MTRSLAVLAGALAWCAVVVSSLAGSPQRGGRGETNGRGRAPLSDAARRVETRTYRFPGTNEKIEYATFASTKVKKNTPSPLVIALHGAGVSPAQMLTFVADAAQDGGYVVYAPMGYALEGWYGIKARVARDAPENLAELSEADVMHVLDIARHDYMIDNRRIYLLGQSMGGAGALYLGVKHHEIWAAVGATAPAAGSLSPASLETVRDLPIVLVHGDADQSVAVAQTRRWAEKMRELMMTYEYDELPGAGHRDAILLGAPRVFAFFGAHIKPATLG
jgi:predicted peptidase